MSDNTQSRDHSEKIKIRHRYRLQKGSYVQPAFTRGDVRLLIWTATFQVLGRVYDYLTPYPEAGQAPSAIQLIERAYPLVIWGTYFLLGAVILVFGLIQKRHLFVWLGHTLFLIGYVLLFVAISVPLVAKYPFDDVRAVTVLLLPTVIQALFVIRTGPKPIRVDRIVKMEGVGGEQA